MSFAQPAGAFPGLSELKHREALDFVAPVTGHLTATRVDNLIEVTGEVQTAVRMPCSRCLEPVEDVCRLDLRLCYQPEEPAPPPETELELDEEDVGLIPFTDDEIDLEPDLVQEIIMALPQQPLCRSDCAGLCPVCGINLNHADCTCERPVFHTGLAALKDLKIEK